MGDHWRMVFFNGKCKISDGIVLLFDSIAQDEEKWMADYSILVDWFNVALSHRGKDPVEADSTPIRALSSYVLLSTLSIGKVVAHEVLEEGGSQFWRAIS
ncbi:hypothetical protein HOY82DRAFT_609520 [Tuber indicum]|nr:hypothetical protein HOY82DRAFT_609520 [Tuber indicum]